MNQKSNKSSLKTFFIKLAAITVSVIIIINMSYNLFFSEKLENINKVLTLNNKESIEEIKDKIRLEIKNGLDKEKILNDEDALLLNKLYLKLIKELKEAK
jgi:hypothetical protein